MTSLRSPLASVVGPSRELDPAEARRAARAAYHDHGIVLIRPEWLDGDAARRMLASLAESVHGRRAEG